MLVLSRRADEKVVLPTVPAVIKVLSSQNGVVRLGIEAPSHVPILREELCHDGRPEAAPAAAPAPEPCPPKVRHILRNRLNNLTLGLALLRMRLQEAGDPAVHKDLAGLEAELEALREYVAAPARVAEADRPHLARGTA
jgi:carbon storage regulator CsrA